MCMFYISYLNTQLLSIVFTVECGVVDKIKDVVQSQSNMCLYVVYSLSLTKSNIGVQLAQHKIIDAYRTSNHRLAIEIEL